MRILNFNDTFSSAVEPTASPLVKVTGSYASPSLITVGGFTPAGRAIEKAYIKGSGGPIDVTANPQVAAGTNDGDELEFECVDNTNSVKWDNGTGLALNGDYTMVKDSVLKLRWNAGASKWTEVSRNDI